MKRRSSATGLNERCASPIIKRTKVHAQRKFAQGSNNYVTTPTKLPKPNDSTTQLFSPETNSAADSDDRELNNFSNLPTVDDFLTFLCYRETDVLPQRLNYLNTPQFESIPTKKKPLKSNSTSSSSLPSNDKASDKLNPNFKSKKNVPEYPLRSKEIKCKPIISKTSRSLALKHNQRLRKTVQTKFTENKLPNFKAKNALNKLPPSKSIADVKVNNVKNHSITRISSATKETPKRVQLEMKRVTRRNSNLNALAEKPEVVKSPAKRSQNKSSSLSVTKELPVTVDNTHIPAKRMPAKSLRVSVAKLPIPLNSSISPIKTRSTRSATARLESNLKTPSTSSRPTRKTKEAATLYMETLGRDLLRGDESFDEDDLSIESYFELPTIEPAKPKKEMKEPSKKPKPVNTARKNTSKLIKKSSDKKSPLKVLDKIHKPVKKVIRKDKAQIEKLNDELKKIVEDKPLKEKLEHITKSIDIDKELETIDQTLNMTKAGKVIDPTKLSKESVENNKKSTINSKVDCVEMNHDILLLNKENKKIEISKDYVGIENIDIPEFMMDTSEELDIIENHILPEKNTVGQKITNNELKKDSIIVENIENIVLPEEEEIIEEKDKTFVKQKEKLRDVIIQQKDKTIVNSNTKNCSMKSTGKSRKSETPVPSKKNCPKKSLEKKAKLETPKTSNKHNHCIEKSIEKVEVPSSAAKNCSKKPTKVEKPEISNLSSKSSLKQSTEKIDKVEAVFKKSTEKIEKAETASQKRIEKVEKSEAPSKKLIEKVKKSEDVSKKSIEKIEKPEALLKKSMEKVQKQALVSKKSAEKLEVPLKKSTEKLEKPAVVLKKSAEKVEKLETVLKKSSEKLEKPAVVLKKSVEKVEKLEAGLKKSLEKLEKPAVVLKKSEEKVEKSEAVLKKSSEKLDKLEKPPVVLKKSVEKVEKSETVLKKSLEKLEKPPVMLKKLEEKVEKSETGLKKSSEKLNKLEKPPVVLKKSVEKVEKSETVLKKSTEKLDKLEKPPVAFKKLVEKVEKSETVLKKSLEKLEKPPVVLKKSEEKVEKSETVLKKSSEKLDKLEKPPVVLKKSVEKVEKLDAVFKKSLEKLEKPAIASSKSLEKVESSEAPLKKSIETIENPQVLNTSTKNCLKKPAEKIEKPEVPSKKPAVKVDKAEDTHSSTKSLKKPAEKIEKPEVPLKKPTMKVNKTEDSNSSIKTLKNPAEKIEKPEVPSKKPSLKVDKTEDSHSSSKSLKKPAEIKEKPEVPSKKPAVIVDKTEDSHSSIKSLNKPSKKIEPHISISQESILMDFEEDEDKESPTVEENLPHKIPNNAKPIAEPKPDSNFAVEECKTNKKKLVAEPVCQTRIAKKNLNRKKPSVKIIRAKASKLDEEETVKQVETSDTTNIVESATEIKTNEEMVINDEMEEDVVMKPMPKLVFANGKATTSEELEKPILESMASSSNKMFCLESKKIIFKKNKTTVVADEKEENSPRKTEAFSADNENSVYAFEPDLPTTSPPFRRLKPVTPPKSLISGNSIAVQVNFESNAKIECSSSSETQVSSTTDCDDRVFYIPIQTSDTNSTLGVAVKLDTDGANQKIIMSATLVTKSSSFTTPTATTVVSRPISSEPSTPEEQPELLKKPPPKENTDKVVATADSQSSSQTPTDSPSSTVVSPKCNKKVSSTTKPSQSVKIVKINKVKKPLPPKPKPKPVRAKNSKSKSAEVTKPVQSTSSSEILEAPTFYPTEAEFNDPLKYIDTIRSVAEKFGLCRIIPPSTFRPECKVADEMRFTAYNQYVHKMLHRWGPNVKEMMAIKKFLTTQNIQLTQVPVIGGMEVDLPRLYQMVQQCGGLKAVIEKERWHQVADVMKIPKLAQDRITKLDDIYCKYLLPYDILSHGEREKLFEEVEKDWNSHLKNPNDDDEVFDDVDECIVKGRTMPLSCFYRIARNTMMMCFGSIEGQQGPSTETIETEFWNHVSQRKSHICVHSGSIDTGVHGYGFSVAKNSTFRKHPWNLKVFTNNSASILRSLGPIMGVTVPTLHVGMLYSACCWYRDPHGLPWVEYLHTGANKIWYGIPDEYSDQFNKAMRILVPKYCRDKRLWLPSDTVMIPPPLLATQNVPLSRVVQQPGQFIVVFPKAFTSCISTGYMVSESVYFAHASWLNSAKQIFSDMQESCEPSVFSLEQLLINVATDVRASLSILSQILPLLIEVRDIEIVLRNQLVKLGLDASQKMQINKKRKLKASFNDEDNYECEICRANLFLSLVMNSHDETNYCLKHAVNLLQKKPSQVKHCKLMCAYTEEELEEVIKKVHEKIETKSNRKPNAKQNSN